MQADEPNGRAAHLRMALRRSEGRAVLLSFWRASTTTSVLPFPWYIAVRLLEVINQRMIRTF